MGALTRSTLMALAGAVALSGCSPAPVLERLPTELGGLPAGVPIASPSRASYPAVHDMPPPRDSTPLTDDQQLKLEKELQTLRDQQEKKAAADEQAAESTKSAASSADDSGNAGAGTKP